MRPAPAVHEPDDVNVRYRTTDTVTRREQEAAMLTLSSHERQRAARFVFDRDRRAYVIAHALLRQELSTYDSVPPERWEFVESAYGKPALAERFARIGLRFNLSHTDGLVACAIARDRDVGIDVERVGRAGNVMELASRYFSALEVEGLERCNAREQEIRFTELWTLKEAYIKGIGIGLSHPLHTYGFAFEGSSRLRFTPPPEVDASTWRFELFAPSECHRLAVAVRSLAAGGDRVHVRRVGLTGSPASNQTPRRERPLRASGAVNEPERSTARQTPQRADDD